MKGEVEMIFFFYFTLYVSDSLSKMGDDKRKWKQQYEDLVQEKKYC